jgi:hypothetical protein
MPQRFLWFIAGCLWFAIIAAGVSLLDWHENKPGIAAAAPTAWPRDSQIQLSDRGNTLVMFAHPRCPCTRASLGELEKIVARCPVGVTPWVVFYKPDQADENWDQTDQCATAAAIPTAHVVRDIDGAEARRFHAITSGQTMLYNQAGELLFSGGITMSRGHAGDNPGRTAIEALLANAKPQNRATPVFGCPILVPSK